MDGQSSTTAWATWRWLLIAGFAIIAAVNLPGQLAFDSVTGLWEGRHHVRMSWGPRMYSAILGFFDHIVPGTGLYMVASMALTALSWAALPAVRRRVAWAGPIVLALAFTLPQVLIYQGIVWRDVLFANLTVAAFAALALSARFWASPGRRWPLLAMGVVFLATGALVRQNGGVVIAPWALALGLIAARGRWGRGLGWGAAGVVAPLALALVFNALNPVQEAPGKSHAIGPRLLAHYDVGAAIVENPQRPLPHLQADRPLSLVVLRRELPGVWSPARIDTLDWTPSVRRALWRFKAASWQAEWRALIMHDPGGYLRRRLEVFSWVFLTPQLDKCVPLHLGVSGLPHIEKELNLVDGPTLQAGQLYAYAQRWFATPFYSHLTYALLALAVGAFLLVRRATGDFAIAGLMVAALGFTATFFLVSIACDYRYLYALDLAAITGVLYVAVDPSLRRRPEDG